MQAPASPEFMLQAQPLAYNSQAFDRRLSRRGMGAVVVVHGCITRHFREDRGTHETLSTHEVAQGLMQKASFASAAPVIFLPAG